MILAALGVGTVVGAIIGVIASPEGGGALGTTDEAKDEGVAKPYGWCESEFQNKEDDTVRKDWYGIGDDDDELTELRKNLYLALDDSEHELMFLDLPAAEQGEICSLLDDEAEQQIRDIIDVNKRLEDANRALLAAEKEIDALRKKGKQKSPRLKELEARVKELEAELEVVTKERDELQSALDSTIVQLENQIEQTRKYRQKAVYYRNESVSNQWLHFKEAAKTNICTERRLKNKRVECQEVLDQLLNKELEAKYSECVKSHQAVPLLREFEKKEARPTYTVALGESGYLKDWGVVFCDPTLPEAGDPDLDDL